VRSLVSILLVVQAANAFADQSGEAFQLRKLCALR
jgi:hypothetical protein